MKRHTTKDERELFQAALLGKADLGRPRPAPANTLRPAAKKAQAAHGPSGVDGRTSERLSRGIAVPDAKLDLHGLTEQAAHKTLLSFLQAAHRRGDRLVLIVTGKGGSEPHAPFDLELAGRSRGVLKTMVPRWLDEAPLARLIADRRTAHRRHGGDGALYVYLRKAKS